MCYGCGAPYGSVRCLHTLACDPSGTQRDLKVQHELDCPLSTAA
jgi:hypothetical protein